MPIGRNAESQATIASSCMTRDEIIAKLKETAPALRAEG